MHYMTSAQKQAQHSFYGLALLSYVLLAVFVLTAASHHGEGTQNCPYMPGQHAVCERGTIDHLHAWQEASTATAPLVLNLLLLLVALSIIGGALYKFFPIQFSSVRQRLRDAPIPLYRNLFASGILNPKAP
jgi:hypothetical protein